MNGAAPEGADRDEPLSLRVLDCSSECRLVLVGGNGAFPDTSDVALLYTLCTLNSCLRDKAPFPLSLLASLRFDALRPFLCYTRIVLLKVSLS